jgi:uncharacterized membrane protein YhaH (DUF805 family)
MNFPTAIQTCLSKYVVWQGRAPRSELWFFHLFVLLAYAAAMIVDGVLGTHPEGHVGLFYSLTSLAIFLPAIAVAVRRLHDLGRSGWWYWIVLIPIVGIIILLVGYCQRGTSGPNSYAPDPLVSEPY